MKTALRHRLTILNDAATKRVIKQFCTKFQFVYFGHVDAQEDEHQLIRGLTVSTNHVDNHYTVGTFQNHDVMFVQRRHILTFPGKPTTDYKWLIMQIDLNRTDMPHIFMDAHRHDETFYANLFVKIPQFQDIRSTLERRDPQFVNHYKVFALPNQYMEVGAVLIPEITNVINQYFRQFDFEIINDRVYVYANANMITTALLQEMLRAGIWLADALNVLKKLHS